MKLKLLIALLITILTFSKVNADQGNADISFYGMSKNRTPQLGRWALDYCTVRQEIKSNNANRDHCGDVICGNQEILKKTYNN